LKIAFYGDMDSYFGAPTMKRLGKIAKSDSDIPDFFIFLGDMAYDLCSSNYLKGESFFV